ncbi:MAG: hypothetical protein PUE26_01790 [Ruminococcus sp.]|nr:hypothetical protein [Ruminococcus sp.]MDD6708869.1 hypothetical protein [Ruminococcus sp.]
MNKGVKTIKKTITITLIIALISCIFLSIPVSATTTDYTERTIEYLDNGDYIETIITDDTLDSGISLYTTNTITKTKTSDSIILSLVYLIYFILVDLPQLLT